MEITIWIEEMQEQLKALKQLKLFYPDGNKLLPPASPTLLDELSNALEIDLPQQFKTFYRYSDGLSLGDIGYIIDDLTTILRGVQKKELLVPTKISGKEDKNIVILGSDGSESLFALTLGNVNEVLELEMSLVENSTYFPYGDEAITVIASDFNGFLEYLLAEVKRHINENKPPNHVS
jgi:hypothetical protein